MGVRKKFRTYRPTYTRSFASYTYYSEITLHYIHTSKVGVRLATF